MERPCASANNSIKKYPICIFGKSPAGWYLNLKTSFTGFSFLIKMACGHKSQNNSKLPFYKKKKGTASLQLNLHVYVTVGRDKVIEGSI